VLAPRRFPQKNARVGAVCSILLGIAAVPR
jgi:hypothetical protein